MPTIKNVQTHADDLHDGRSLAPYEAAVITDDELALEHYQSRLRDGSILLVPQDQVAISDGLDDLTIPKLQEQADKAGLDLPKSLTKPEIIEALRQHATNPED